MHCHCLELAARFVPWKASLDQSFLHGRYDSLLDGQRLLDSGIYMHFYATGITPAMAIKNIVKGSQYAIACLDKDGNSLDGSKTYKIHPPKHVPAKDVWSFTLCDNQTRGLLQTDQRFPGVDGNKPGLKPGDPEEVKQSFSGEQQCPTAPVTGAPRPEAASQVQNYRAPCKPDCRIAASNCWRRCKSASWNSRNCWL